MAESDEQKERRVSVELREIFVVAYEVVEPFLDPKNSWGGQTHEHLAYRTVHERFPQLTGEDVFIIISAAKRVYASGGRPAPAAR
ncbi:MAG: hypothetical protein Q8O34_16845 [Rhodocyclaceae bacterium]|nr:hypothetical protein [Rhodocyclaceae bacterium]